MSRNLVTVSIFCLNSSACSYMPLLFLKLLFFDRCIDHCSSRWEWEDFCGESWKTWHIHICLRARIPWNRWVYMHYIDHDRNVISDREVLLVIRSITTSIQLSVFDSSMTHSLTSINMLLLQHLQHLTIGSVILTYTHMYVNPCARCKGQWTVSCMVRRRCVFSWL